MIWAKVTFVIIKKYVYIFLFYEDIILNCINISTAISKTRDLDYYILKHFMVLFGYNLTFFILYIVYGLKNVVKLSIIDSD